MAAPATPPSGGPGNSSVTAVPSRSALANALSGASSASSASSTNPTSSASPADPLPAPQPPAGPGAAGGPGGVDSGSGGSGAPQPPLASAPPEPVVAPPAEPTEPATTAEPAEPPAPTGIEEALRALELDPGTIEQSVLPAGYDPATRTFTFTAQQVKDLIAASNVSRAVEASLGDPQLIDEVRDGYAQYLNLTETIENAPERLLRFIQTTYPDRYEHVVGALKRGLQVTADPKDPKAPAGKTISAVKADLAARLQAAAPDSPDAKYYQDSIAFLDQFDGGASPAPAAAAADPRIEALEREIQELKGERDKNSRTAVVQAIAAAASASYDGTVSQAAAEFDRLVPKDATAVDPELAANYKETYLNAVRAVMDQAAEARTANPPRPTPYDMHIVNLRRAAIEGKDTTPYAQALTRAVLANTRQQLSKAVSGYTQRAHALAAAKGVKIDSLAQAQRDAATAPGRATPASPSVVPAISNAKTVEEGVAAIFKNIRLSPPS